MVYVAGFVAAVPEADKQPYLDFSVSVVDMFRQFGVQRMLEAWEDDVPDGEQTDFRRAVAAEAGERIVFSLHEYADAAAAAAARDMMSTDPRMEQMGQDMPFDASRMIFGGFAVISDIGGGAGPGYIDGAIIPVPRAARDAYVALARHQGEILLKLGATRVVDTLGDDVPVGERTDFRRAVAALADETVGFSWVEWPDRATRDEAWQTALADPEMFPEHSPVDETRRVYGGFLPILDVNGS